MLNLISNYPKYSKIKLLVVTQFLHLCASLNLERYLVTVLSVENTMIRIGFDAKRLFTDLTGFGSYSRTIIRNLLKHFPNNQYVLFTPEITHSKVEKDFLNHGSINIVSPHNFSKFLWRSTGIWFDLKRENIDLFHGLTHEIPRAVNFSNVPKVVTICDVVYRHFPEQYNTKIIQDKDKALLNACNSADKIVAISHSTKQDLVNLFHIDPSKINVIYPSHDIRFSEHIPTDKVSLTKRQYHLPDKYFLYLGSVTERKNLLSAVKAIELLSPEDRLPLVVVGKHAAYAATVIDYVRNNNLKKSIQFKQVDADADLPAIYRGAEIFIYPSLFEGFGIPVLEALCSGLPVITSNISSLPEVAGPNSRLIEPNEPDTIAEAISNILGSSDLRTKMISSGYQHANNFNSKKLTNQLVDLYSRCIEEKTV